MASVSNKTQKFLQKSLQKAAMRHKGFPDSKNLQPNAEKSRLHMVRILGSQVKMMTTMITLIQTTPMMTFQRRVRPLMSLMTMSLQKPALLPL